MILFRNSFRFTAALAAALAASVIISPGLAEASSHARAGRPSAIDPTVWRAISMHRVKGSPWIDFEAFRTSASSITIWVYASTPKAKVLYSGLRGKNHVKSVTIRNGKGVAKIPGNAAVIEVRTIAAAKQGRWVSRYGPAPDRAVIEPPPPFNTAKPSEHTFMNTNDLLPGAPPVRWNPCRVITWYYRRADADDLALLAQAFSQAAAATGIAFQQVQSADNADIVADVDLMKVRPDDLQRLDGHGGAYFRFDSRVPSATQYTKGYLTAEATTNVQPASRLTLYLHELGHALGLDHVSSRTEVMYPSISVGRPVPAYAAGDLEGLRQLGAGQGCIPPLP